MEFIRNLSFRLKIAILVFLIAFTFFNGFVLIEDLLIFKGLLKEQANWVTTKRGLRISFGFLFSILIGVISYSSFQLFYNILRNMLELVRTWNETEKAEDLNIPRKDEIGSFFRSLQILLYQEEEKNEKKIQKAIQKNQIQTMARLVEDFPKIQLHKVPGLDFSVFPSQIRSPQQDILYIAKVQDGILGILSGSDSLGFPELQRKASLSMVFQYLELEEGLDGSQILKKLNRLVSPPPSPYWNYTCFYFQPSSGNLTYTSYQQIPFLVWSETGIRELDKIPEVFVENDGISEDKIFTTQIFEKEWIFLFSDRILRYIHLNPGQLIQELDHRILKMESLHIHSRDLVVSIAKHFSKRYGKRIFEALSFLAIHKV